MIQKRRRVKTTHVRTTEVVQTLLQVLTAPARVTTPETGVRKVNMQFTIGFVRSNYKRSWGHLRLVVSTSVKGKAIPTMGAIP